MVVNVQGAGLRVRPLTGRVGSPRDDNIVAFERWNKHGSLWASISSNFWVRLTSDITFS